MSWGRNPARAWPVPMAGWWRCEQVHGVRLSPGRVLCKERRRCWPFVRMAGSLSGEGLHPRVCPCQETGDCREQVRQGAGAAEFVPHSAAPSASPMSPLSGRQPGCGAGSAVMLAAELEGRASPDSAHRAVWKRREECCPHPAFHLLARLAANSAPRRADLHAEPPPCSPDPGPIGLKSRLASSLSTYFIEENFCSCTWENGFLVRL